VLYSSDFQLTVSRATEGARSGLDFQDVHGASIGRSEDGQVTLAMLGARNAESRAAALASLFALHRSVASVADAGCAAIVVLDHVTRDVWTVTPRIALRQVFWSRSGDHLRLASSPDLDRGAELDLDALYAYVYFHMVPSPMAAVRGSAKLDTGETLLWRADDVTTKRHWRPAFDDAANVTEAEAASHLRSVLSDAVSRAMDGVADVGAFLSGGLDSSTVAGLAAQVRSGIPTVSMGFEAQGYDELEYARIASRHFRTRPLEYYVTPEDVLATLPRIAAAFPEPFGNSSAAAAFHCARIAREQGLQRLLAGDGGDELFGGNVRYATQLVFERYQLVPSPLRRWAMEPAVNAAGRITRRFPIGKAVSYIQQANVPLPDRLQSYNFLHRHDPREVFAPGMLEGVRSDRPLRLLREEYAMPTTSSPVNRMLFLDWKFTLHDNDLVKVNTMCALAGVEVAYPMLDPAVIDFSLRLPGDWKVRRGELRWFYKRAMRDFLPREIIDKSKHGFGLPFGVWTRTHDGLRKAATDALDSLATRGFFRREFLQQALRLHREGHASYYGELVWILMVLELWLQAHLPRASL
jgi:asparagine synthase (glutamine-hydrolysing)